MKGKVSYLRTISFVLGMFCLVAMVAISSSLEAANLYAALVVDSEDESIGMSTEIDLYRVRSQIKKIAYYTELDLKEVILKGCDTTPSQLFEALDRWEIEPDDIVIFYFSGHGHRTSQNRESPWPILDFTLENKGIELDAIRQKLEDFHPRLLLVIADVCNSLISDEWAVPLVRKGRHFILEEECCKKNYHRLFLDTIGTIIVTSSRAGEPSWDTDQGGVFTIAFLKSLNRAAKYPKKPSWQKILDRASLEIFIDQRRRRYPHYSIQHPYYQLNIKTES